MSLDKRDSFIKVAAQTAEAELGTLCWNLASLDESARGKAIFKNNDGFVLIIEIGYWWPDGAPHLDDQPGIVLFYQEKEADSVKVQVPFIGERSGTKLHWTSAPSEIKRQALEEIRNFKNTVVCKYCLKVE